MLGATSCWADDLAKRHVSPASDGAYWTAMFIAGVFGTVAGDLIHHNVGLYNASAALCVLLAGLILAREKSAPLSMLLFWSIVMAERCAGTAVGDALASRRAVGLGVPIASVCTRPDDHLALGARPALATVPIDHGLHSAPELRAIKVQSFQ
jgi:hypothetical protein